MKLIEQYERITTNDLKERARVLYTLLKDSLDLASLQEIGRRESKKLRKHYKPSSIGTNLSRAGYYKYFREIKLIAGKNAVQVKKADGTLSLQHAFIEQCGLSVKEWDERNESTRVSKRLNSPRKLDSSAILKTAEQLIDSKDRREIAIGLMLATGRRPHEIIARAKFELIENENWHVKFTGQGKKRGEKPTFTIATLLPASKCRSALNRLRRDPYIKQTLKDAIAKHPRDIIAQNQIIDSRTNSSHNRTIAKHLSKLIPQREGDQNITCKNLRAAYLVIATERDHRNSSIGQKMVYAARLAGHITENEKPSDRDLEHIATTLGYTDYQSSQVPYQKNPGQAKLKRIEITQQDLHQIDRWKTQWKAGSRHATIEKLITLAHQQLSTPAPETQTSIQTKTQQNTPNESITKERIRTLEDKMEQLIELLTLRQIAENTPTQIETSRTREKTSKTQVIQSTPLLTEQINQPLNPEDETRILEKNAKAMVKYENMSYGKLTQTKGHGVSFARCQRVYEALQQYNEQNPDPEQKIALNKALLRSVDGCSNSTASNWLTYFANDIADYHASQNITDPKYHNRKYHRGDNFPTEIKLLIQ